MNYQATETKQKERSELEKFYRERFTDSLKDCIQKALDDDIKQDLLNVLHKVNFK